MIEFKSLPELKEANLPFCPKFYNLLSRTLLLLIIMGVSPVKAQSIFLNHAHYGSCGVSANPALSLLSTKGSLSFTGRQQWVGVDGAPRVFWGSGHIGLERLGATAGVHLSQDRVGVERHTEASLFFAKSVRISERDYIGLSLNAGLAHYDARYSSLDGADPSFRDDVLESDALLGFGAVIYRPDVYYAGISMPRFTMGGVGVFGDTRYNFQNSYYFTGAIVLPVGEELHLRPSVLVS